MSIIQALILGIVQGATEFLPISSSGHLVVVPFILGWDEPTVAFDVAVHAGTLIAVLYVFWDRVKPLLRALRDKSDEQNRHMITLLFIGTLPAAVVGLAFTDFLEASFHRPVVVSLEIGLTGWLLFTGDRLMREHEERAAEEALAVRRAQARGEPLPQTKPLRNDNDLTAEDALFIGSGQALAIMPGISRSGATVVAAMKQGITREAAIRYSFLLSIPAIAGAIVFKTPDIISQSASGEAGVMLVGLISSTITGVLAIRWFIRLFMKSGLRAFGVYCFLFMIAGLLTGLARG